MEGRNINISNLVFSKIKLLQWKTSKEIHEELTKDGVILSIKRVKFEIFKLIVCERGLIAFREKNKEEYEFKQATGSRRSKDKEAFIKFVKMKEQFA